MSGWKETDIGTIPKEWNVANVDDIKSSEKKAIISGPFGSNISSKYFVEYGIPVIRGNNLSIGKEKFIDNGFVYITEEKAKELGTWALQGDLIFTAAGTLGQVGIIQENQKFDRYIISNKQLRLRVDEEKIHPLFAYYWFSSPHITKLIISRNTGSTIPLINLSVLKSLPIPVPQYKEQCNIINIILSLDNKIYLLRRQNATLKNLAQTLFKRWFVEFEFPNEAGQPYKSGGGAMVVSDFGEIPAEWGIGKLGEYLDIKHGFAFRGEFITTKETANILLTPGNFRIGGGFNSSKFKYYDSGDFPDDYLLLEGDLLVTMTDLSKAGDTLGYPAILPIIQEKQLLHNQRLGKVLFVDETVNKYFIYWLMCSREYRWHILGTASGSTVKHTSPTRILDFDFVIPSHKVLRKFSTLSQPLFDKLSINFQQLQTLTRLRDTLLPKLMGGKIRVNTDTRRNT